MPPSSRQAASACESEEEEEVKPHLLGSWQGPFVAWEWRAPRASQASSERRSEPVFLWAGFSVRSRGGGRRGFERDGKRRRDCNGFFFSLDSTINRMNAVVVSPSNKLLLVCVAYRRADPRRRTALHQTSEEKAGDRRRRRQRRAAAAAAVAAAARPFVFVLFF